MGIRRKSEPVTAEIIIDGYCNRVLREKVQNRVYPNIYLGKWEADILEITKAGYLYEFEVKISRRDFKIDASKTETYGRRRRKYDVLKAGERVNYFSYIVPEGLIAPEEVPEWAGLIYARSYKARVCVGFDPAGGPIFEEQISVSLSTVKDPVKLRQGKITPQEESEIQKKLYFRFHKIRCKLIGQKLVTPFGVS